MSRPRLVERLEGGLDRKLTVISAPAGFGKTTLVSEWVDGMRSGAANDNQATCETAWLSLDEGDNDPIRFLAYLIAALQTIEANIGKGVLGALQSPQPPPAEAILISVINEVAALSGRILLVLDDYHLMEAQPIHDAVTFLLEHLPPQMHLVIATREDPRLPVARLRVQGHLTELRAADLRFTRSEAAEFLHRVMGLDLSAEDIAALERRTEGWIAGLQLAALSMQGRQNPSELIESFTGSHRYVLDYLIEEVLEQQSESIQAFLLQTSVLDRLSGPLCDAVRFGVAKAPGSSSGTAVLQGAGKAPGSSSGTAVFQGAGKAPGSSSGTAVVQGVAESSGSSRGTAVVEGAAGGLSGQAILERLDHANLFIIPMDEERHWYRYHRLFVDLLRQRLHRTQPEQLPILHLRASEWYEQNGYTDDAIEHALRREDFERAADKIEESVDHVLHFGEHTTLRRWLDQIPVEVTLSKPHLCILHAGNLYIGGQVDEAERYLQAAEQALDLSASKSDAVLAKTDPLLAADRLKYRGRVGVVRSFLLSHKGDVEEAIEVARQALEILPKSDSTWRCSAFDSIGTAYSSVDDVSAYDARAELLEASYATGNAYMILFASLRLVVTLRDLGRLQQATEICQQQLELANENGLSQTALVGWLYTLLGEILAERNELDRALQLTNKGVELTERGKDVILLGSSYMCLMRVLFSKGELDLARKIIQDVDHSALKQNLSPWIVHQLAAWQARIWVAQDKLDPASRWAEECDLDINGELTPLHDFDYVMLARVLVAQARLDEATRLLQRLLDAAEAGGRTSKSIEILVLQALARQARGDSIQAVSALERALALAEPGGFVRVFVDEGPPMARLLYQVAARGIMPDYSARLLAAFEEAGKDDGSMTGLSLSSSASDPSPALVEPLSQREIEVL
ncbi:MAG TPA: hypothetical protein VLY63_24390, partial [Anaerolineae bacterium]|nr:hypothetical protein [Anaerolineae bacterium]